MSNTNKIYIALGILILIIILFNWRKIFGKRNGSTSNTTTPTDIGTGTGIRRESFTRQELIDMIIAKYPSSRTEVQNLDVVRLRAWCCKHRFERCCFGN